MEHTRASEKDNVYVIAPVQLSPTYGSFVQVTLKNLNGDKPDLKTMNLNQETNTYDSVFETDGYCIHNNKDKFNHSTTHVQLGSDFSSETTGHTESPDKPGKNPFDDGVAERLHLPSVSPTVFSAVMTPNRQMKDKKPFRWSIEQMAVLHPADIEEIPQQEHPLHGTDEEIEEKAQKAIDEFFSQKVIVPSPWTTNNVRRMDSCSASAIYKCRVDDIDNAFVKDACCQTTLSLPPNFDLQTLLGEYFNFSDKSRNSSEKNEDQKETLSTSTLRRKLFFHEEETSISPIKIHTKENSKQCYSAASPISMSTSENSKEFISPKSCKSDQFASSPIIARNCQSPLLSSSPIQLTSPIFSPRSRSSMKTPIYGSPKKYLQSSFDRDFSCKESMHSAFLQNALSAMCVDKHYLGKEALYNQYGVKDFFAKDNSKRIPEFLTENKYVNSSFLDTELGESLPCTTSQDTGYQTSSLQMTTQDYHYPNITNQDFTHTSTCLCVQSSSSPLKTSSNILQISGKYAPLQKLNCSCQMVEITMDKRQTKEENEYRIFTSSSHFRTIQRPSGLTQDTNDVFQYSLSKNISLKKEEMSICTDDTI